MEEPESHIFPFLLNLIIDYVRKALDYTYVVMSTRNPLLLSLLWDRVKNVETYYIYRDEFGSTRAAKLDIDRIARDMIVVDELLLKPPTEVLKKYTIGAMQIAKSQPNSAS